MSRITACRSCREQVAIPEGFGQGELVRCPRCQAEYPVSEVLAEATQAADVAEPPPELLPVAAAEDDQDVGSSPGEVEAAGGEHEHEVPSDQLQATSEIDSSEAPEIDSEAEEPPRATDAPVGEVDEPEEKTAGPGAETQAPAEETAEPATDGEEPADKIDEPAEEAAGPVSQGETGELPRETEAGEPVSGTAEPAVEPSGQAGGDEAIEVRCPHCGAEYPLSRAVVVGTGAELGPVVAAAVARDVLPGQAAPSDAPALDAWAKADAMPQIDLGEGGPPQTVTADAVAFDFARKEAEDEGVPTGRVGPRRPRQKSMAREIGGWLFGAAAGLVIAYYLLNFIRGEAGNFLEIPLPGVPHTYQYSPDWFPGFLKPAPEPDGMPAEETADLELLEIQTQPNKAHPDEKSTVAE